MNVELKGVLKVIFAEEKVNDRMSKKEIVVTIDGDTEYPQDIICQAVNKNIEKIDASFKMGDTVTVKCDLRGRESKGRYYNHFNLFDIRKG
jgi:hypothetical protein